MTQRKKSKAEIAKENRELHDQLSQSLRNTKKMQRQTQKDIQRNQEELERLEKQRRLYKQLFDASASLAVVPPLLILAMTLEAVHHRKKEQVAFETKQKAFKEEKLKELVELGSERLEIIGEARKHGVELSEESKEKMQKDILTFTFEDEFEFEGEGAEKYNKSARQKLHEILKNEIENWKQKRQQQKRQYEAEEVE